MERSFRTDTIYALGPNCPDDANNSQKLYAAYRESDAGMGYFSKKSMSFIEYARAYHVVGGKVKSRPQIGGGHNTGKARVAIGVRFAYEMLDLYIYHYCAMFFPHYHRDAFVGTELTLKFTMSFLGCMQYLLALTPADADDCVFGEAIPNTTRRYRYARSAFPQPLPALPMSREVAFGCML